MSWDVHIREIDGFPRADWDAIANQIQSANSETWNVQWSAASEHWLNRIKERLGSGYCLCESANFLLLTERPERYRDSLLAFLERALAAILKLLPNIAQDEGYGKHIVLVFSDLDEYYQYLSHYYPEEGHFAGSSGIFLSLGYGHFAFPDVDLANAEAVAAHELTHACLAHLPIPLWLNEGLAVSAEDSISGSAPLMINESRMLKHQRFWGDEEIQEFWSGESFLRPDEGNELSYELARYCVKLLSGEYELFVDFANHADAFDAGESAAVEIYGGGLGGLIEHLFGSGTWDPDPSRWSHLNSNNLLQLTRPPFATRARDLRRAIEQRRYVAGAHSSLFESARSKL